MKTKEREKMFSEVFGVELQLKNSIDIYKIKNGLGRCLVVLSVEGGEIYFSSMVIEKFLFGTDINNTPKVIDIKMKYKPLTEKQLSKLKDNK